MPVEFDVCYKLERREGTRRAKTTNLSVGGLRLCCDEELVDGSILYIQFKLPDEFVATMTVEEKLYDQGPFGLRPESIRVQPRRFAPMDAHAKVLTHSFDADQHKFAHSMAFLQIDPSTRSELERFTHLWQLSYCQPEVSRGGGSAIHPSTGSGSFDTSG